MTKFKLSNYTVTTDILDEEAKVPKRIIYSTLTGQAVTISDEIYQDLKNSNFDKIANDILLKLINFEFIVTDKFDDFEFVNKINSVSINDNNVLGVTMQPGANCQLGCHYCGQVHTKKYMDEALYEPLIERISNNLSQRDYKAFSVTWYGGEPLMALPQIRSLSKRFKDLVLPKDLEYRAGMITNGLSLKNKIFEELVLEHQVTFFQITIDTVAEHHDKRRITKTGEKTFDLIFKNVIDVTNNPIYKEKKCNIVIRINIDSSNYESVIPFLDFLAEKKLNDKVSVDFAPVANWGGNDAGKESLTKEDFAVIEIDWLMHAIKLGFRFNLIPGRSFQVCMVVDENQEVYDANGNIYPCWEFPYTPVYEGGDYKVGNILEDSSSYNMDAITRNWHEDVKDEKIWCNTCTYYPVCGGACPKHWHEGTPACPSFKYNMEDKLVLQYLMDKNNIEELF